MNQPAAIEEGVLNALRRICRALDVHSRELARECDLTSPQLMCLRVLGDAGTMMPSEMARAVSLSQATVTGILDRLSQRKLITRRRNPRDKRRVILRLTDAGRDLLANAPSPLHGGLATTLRAMSDIERITIHDTLERVAEIMDADLSDR